VPEGPIRLERDGALAVMILEDPPLNLFGRGAFESFTRCIAEVEVSDVRALVWRAEGDIFTGGVDVRVFEGTDAGTGSAMFSVPLPAVSRLEGLPIPRWPSSAPSPHRGAGGLARLRPDLGKLVGTLRPGRGRGRAHPRGWRHPADGRARRPGRAREFVMSGGLHDAATLERSGVVNEVVPDGRLLARGMDSPIS
jgi:enoyl-CoA hydratase